MIERRTASATVAALLVFAIVACSTATPQTPGPTGSGTPTGVPGPSESEAPGADVPSRATLINAAVDEGRLDPVTGLLYRAYGLFGLPGLPDEFAAGFPRADDALLAEMVELMPTLSTEDQAKLRPFVVRPTDPDSIFAAAPAAMAGIGPIAQVPPPASPWTCRDWANSGTADTRFKVWACRDQDAAKADADIATISAMVTDIWEPMTKDEPDGMGPPLPDGYENVSPEYGGDARIDFYAVELGQVIYRDGNQSIAVDAAAAAGTSPPYTNREDGSSRNSSSGFVLVNRNRLKYPVEMKQDVIHEFFHVLQYAHNRRAPFNGTDSHWFREASAVWAETFYFRSNSDEPHKRFATHFQPSAAGLADPNVDHQYAAYIWPFFMEQEKGESAVFQAWAAIDSLASGDFAGVTKAVSDQLPFDKAFRNFAVRNLNINDVLQSAALTQYKTQDKFLYDDKPPTTMASGTVTPQSPYLSPDRSIPPLAATYVKLEVAPTSREVTVTLGYSPGTQIDGDAIVHVRGQWKHRPIVGGRLKFCRDDPPDDIDSLYVIVSNHGLTSPESGFVKATAKETCEPDALTLSGTIVGHYDNLQIEAWQARQVSETSMQVHLILEPNRMQVDGTVSISGEVTGDCMYSDSGTGTFHWDSNEPTTVNTEAAQGYVTLSMSDPRYMFPDLKTIVLYVGALIDRRGGTCGHTNGPVFDAYVPFSITSNWGSCGTLEVNRADGGTWTADCTEEPEVEGQGTSTVTVRLAETPMTTPTP